MRRSGSRSHWVTCHLNPFISDAPRHYTGRNLPVTGQEAAPVASSMTLRVLAHFHMLAYLHVPRRLNTVKCPLHEGFYTWLNRVKSRGARRPSARISQLYRCTQSCASLTHALYRSVTLTYAFTQAFTHTLTQAFIRYACERQLATIHV